MAIKVCIVDDNEQIRIALEQVINLSDGFEFMGSFMDCKSAVEKIPSIQPDVVLMDINLGKENGIDCIRILKPLDPKILYMICTVYEEDEKIFDALKAGANGYILKKTPPKKILEAIKDLSEGGAPMSSQIARKVVAVFQESIRDSKIENLSAREKEILELIAKGLMNKEIADQLFISHETVRKHIYHIYEKLHVSNRIEAINKYFGRK